MAILERAKALIAAQRPQDALTAYKIGWDDTVAHGDHLGASTIAHMAGVAEPDLAAKLEWNERALGEADAEPDRAGMEPLYPSLYNNLAVSHALLGDRVAALRYLRLARDRLGSLEPGPYADRVREAILKRLTEFEAEQQGR